MTEFAVLWLRAKERQGWPATARSQEEAREDPPLEPSEDTCPSQLLAFRLRASRTVTERISVVKAPSLWSLVTAALGN